MLLQAVRVGTEAVAEQCRAIEGWRKQVGCPKRHESAHSTEGLEARIEALCRDDVEASYRHSARKFKTLLFAFALMRGVSRVYNG